MTNAVRRILAALVPRSLQAQMMCAVSAVVLFTIVVSGVIVFRVVEGTLEEQIGVRALQIAQTVALVPEVRQAVVTGDPERNIQELAESMRQRTGAEFIVVADGTARRLSHPVPERIGQEFVGGDVDCGGLFGMESRTCPRR